MEFLKVFSPWIVSLIIVVSGYVKLQSQVKNNQETIKKHDKLLTSGNGGGAPFITGPEHDKLQSTCQAKIEQKIDSIETSMNKMEETMKKGDQCRSEAREENNAQLSAIRRDMKVFQNTMNDSVKEMFTTINPLVTKTALNELEIEHLKQSKK